MWSNENNLIIAVMTTERLTEMIEEYLPKRYYGHEARNNARRFAITFAAQEVEAAIAETKKQRDELFRALVDIRNRLYLTDKSANECFDIAKAAITNAQEK
jgi:hypothetical protein